MKSLKEKYPYVTAGLLAVGCWMAYSFSYSINGQWFSLVQIAALLVAILQAVYFAESIAHRIGEPFGTLVLALAVTCIEASLIISLMRSGGPENATLARDTVFAAVMIILTAMIGSSLLIGGLKYREQAFIIDGANATVTTLIAIAVLTLILPNYTTSVPGPYYNNQQLIMVSVVTLVLYGSFIFIQNFSHKSMFVDPAEADEEQQLTHTNGNKYTLLIDLFLLTIYLMAVVFLAKSLSTDLENFIDGVGAPRTLAGVIIAAVILLPEGLSAYRASTKNQLQKSLNLSLGSALASISLTMPVVSFYSILSGTPITLGIDAISSIFFFLSIMIVILSLNTGRTTFLQGIILLVIFFVYLFTIMVP